MKSKVKEGSAQSGDYPVSIPQKEADIRFGNHTAEIKSEYMTRMFNDLMGRILTIIDASYSDVEQRKAVKSLARNAIWSECDVLQKWMYEQQGGKGSSFPFD